MLAKSYQQYTGHIDRKESKIIFDNEKAQYDTYKKENLIIKVNRPNNCLDNIGNICIIQDNKRMYKLSLISRLLRKLTYNSHKSTYHQYKLFDFWSRCSGLDVPIDKKS